MRSLRKEREETHEVLYLEGKEKEEKEGAGFKVQLKWGLTSPPLRGSEEGCTRPPLPLLPASLLAQTHNEPGGQTHRSRPDLHQPGDEFQYYLEEGAVSEEFVCGGVRGELS